MPIIVFIHMYNAKNRVRRLRHMYKNEIENDKNIDFMRSLWIWNFYHRKTDFYENKNLLLCREFFFGIKFLPSSLKRSQKLHIYDICLWEITLGSASALHSKMLGAIWKNFVYNKNLSLGILIYRSDNLLMNFFGSFSKKILNFFS
jgi:hypothetical protein